ncbi:hypothetical protein PGT21_022576 [Puccinia graminis f. sp. tritici]|uniref:Uncharacterized protein n=1 Tax=Puccinia graminis f. sp. tritici TaxID=56615 RepID=A0A5B0MCI0_PUCGR|nr:hypothetical protein PGT21_022576 [Puccinia graminis f. sp. tritici]
MEIHLSLLVLLQLTWSDSTMFFEYGFPQDRCEIAPDSPERFHERAVVGLVEGHWLDACNQPINQKLMMDSSNRPVHANHILLCEPSPLAITLTAGTAFERGLESQPEHEALRSVSLSLKGAQGQSYSDVADSKNPGRSPKR